MVDAKTGDRVVCKIKNAEIVSASSDYDEKRTFEIIATSFQGWHIYIPPFITIKGTTPVTQRNYKSLNIDPKFIGWDTLFITGSFIVEVSEKITGVVCKECLDHFKDAEANQEDGTFICWLCRNYKHYH
jgi:hypothetical protein